MAFDETIMAARSFLREFLIHYRIGVCELIAVDGTYCCQYFDKSLSQLSQVIQWLKFCQIGHTFNVIIRN